MNEQRPNRDVVRHEYPRNDPDMRYRSTRNTQGEYSPRRYASQAQIQRERIERAKARERRRRRDRMINLIFVLLLAVVIIVAGVILAGLLFPDDPSAPVGGESGSTPSDATEIKTEQTTPATEAETEPLSGPEAYGITFISDLSEFEEYMDPSDRDAFLTLVNKTHSVEEGYVPEGMVDVVDTRADGRATQQMLPYAAKALEALYIEMRAYGYTDVSVTSGFRSYEYQGQLFEGYVNREMNSNPGMTREEAEEQANTFSARPGTSEHHTGLCCDMHNLSSASTAFANEEAYTWLVENCWKFGFILRYPEDKTEITGYQFEPWHYRYVGRYHAKRIHDLGICFEEYLEILEQESADS